MRALISELKIMVHMGQHLNVVNLLGAVTKNIVQRKQFHFMFFNIDSFETELIFKISMKQVKLWLLLSIVASEISKIS